MSDLGSDADGVPSDPQICPLAADRPHRILPFADIRYEVTLSSGCVGLDAMLRAIICGLAKGKTSRTQHDDVPNGHDLPPFMSQVFNRW